MYTVNTSQYAGTFITDVVKGGGFATSGLTNSGNLTSKHGGNLVAYANGGTSGRGSGMATVVISNTGTLIAQSGVTPHYSMLGIARANTDYTGSNAGTITGGVQ